MNHSNRRKVTKEDDTMVLTAHILGTFIGERVCKRGIKNETRRLLGDSTQQEIRLYKTKRCCFGRDDNIFHDSIPSQPSMHRSLEMICVM